MAAAAALQVLLFALFPLRLLAFCRRDGGPRPRCFLRTVLAIALVCAVVLSSYGVGASAEGNEMDALRSEIEALKHRIALLESTVPKSFGDVDCAARIKAMEDEVRVLKEESRKMNFEISNIASLAHDAEKKVDALKSEVKKTESIITEQWFQVRQLEQAFQMTKIMASKVYKRSRSVATNLSLLPGKNALLKFFGGIHIEYPDTFSFWRKSLKQVQRYSFKVSQFFRAIDSPSVKKTDDPPNVFFLACSLSTQCISNAYNLVKTAISVAHRCHQELQQHTANAVNSGIEKLLQAVI